MTNTRNNFNVKRFEKFLPFEQSYFTKFAQKYFKRIDCNATIQNSFRNLLLHFYKFYFLNFCLICTCNDVGLLIITLLQHLQVQESLEQKYYMWLILNYLLK